MLVLAAMLALAACGVADRPQRAGRGRVVSDLPVKLGLPYKAGGRTWVPADDRAYDRIGAASWYGAAHRGRPTANGERSDPAGISAAHATLPLPSYVEVTALATGRTILVRINDRGPFVPTRIIDLSQGAARLLGIERDGVARVRVRRVFPGEADRAALRAGRPAGARPAVPRQALAALAGRSAAPPRASVPPAARIVAPGVAAPLPASPPGSRPAFLDLGGFDDADRADAFASAAGALGPAAVIGRGAEWRVRIGPFADEAMARSALARAGAAGYHDAQIVRESDR